MKILLIGSDARTHKLAAECAKSLNTTELACLPGNPGIGHEILACGENIVTKSIEVDDIPSIVRFARSWLPDVTISGPELPYSLGLVDALKQEGFSTIGPTKAAARLEGSKCWSQEFMERFDIPVARGKNFDRDKIETALKYLKKLGWRAAIKADGLCGGKGVEIVKTESSATAEIGRIAQTTESSYQRFVIQELLAGEEISVHVIMDKYSNFVFPLARDYKKLNSTAEAPNTGGMGAYSCPQLALSDAHHKTIQDIVGNVRRGLRKEGLDFNGVLFIGIMLTAEGPRVLEFNVRFGDPEWQVFSGRVQTDWPRFFWDTAQNQLNNAITEERIGVTRLAHVAVTLAAAGYPKNPRIGDEIRGLSLVEREMPNVKVLHGATREEDGRLYTNGGRVLSVCGWGRTLIEARTYAYKAVEAISFHGMQFHDDIGKQ